MISRTIVGLIVGVAVAACGSTVSGSDGGGNDAGGTDGKKGPCDGLGCASGPGTLTVHMKDAQTMQALTMASFTEAGKPASASCKVDQQMMCTGDWVFQNLFIGPHTIEARSPGHAPKTFTVTISGPAGCCGLGPDVEETVLLAAVDPAVLCTSTGGTIDMGMCCMATPDFPDSCLTGACGCSPQSSKSTKVCACPSQQCFDAELGCRAPK